jgi:hypothetical protein
VWKADYEKPMRTDINKRDAAQLFFLRLSVGGDRQRPNHQRGKCRTAASKLFTSEKQENRFHLLQCHACLPLDIKDSLKEDPGFCLGAFA